MFHYLVYYKHKYNHPDAHSSIVQVTVPSWHGQVSFYWSCHPVVIFYPWHSQGHETPSFSPCFPSSRSHGYYSQGLAHGRQALCYLTPCFYCLWICITYQNTGSQLSCPGRPWTFHSLASAFPVVEFKPQYIFFPKHVLGQWPGLLTNDTFCQAWGPEQSLGFTWSKRTSPPKLSFGFW